MSASTKEELLLEIKQNPGKSPYGLVSGIVRMVAVDRWCNELQGDELIEVVDIPKNNEDVTVKATEKGERFLKALNSVGL